MHVVWVNTHAAPVGGCERLIEKLVSLLTDRGIRSTLLYDANCRVDPAYLDVFDAAYPLAEARQQLRTLHPDLIYVHQTEDTELLATLALQRAPVLRFYHDHRLLHLSGSGSSVMSSAVGGYRLPYVGSLQRGVQGLQFRSLAAMQRELRLNRSFDGAVVGSAYMKEQLLRHSFQESQVHVLPLFADRVSEPGVTRQDGLLLFAGQLVRGKGVDLLIRALRNSSSTCQLAIAGSGSQEEELRTLVEQLKLGNRVQFLGHLQDSDLHSWMARASCLVLPHRLPETFGLVGPEAMRFGTPVIASQLGGVSEWLRDGENGIGVPPGAVPALMQAIDTLLSDKDLWMRLSAGAKESYAARFTPQQHVEGFLNLVEQLPQPATTNYTVTGSPQVEELIQGLINRVVDRVREYAPKNTRAVVLFGGYGKGEGGVIERDGVQHPHNNLDLLVLTATPDPLLQSTLTHACEALVQEAAVGIDITVMTEKALRSSQPNLMWYDLQGGHHTVYGDPSIALTLPFSDPAEIPPIEIQRLLVNRGSLLVINDWLRKHGDPERIRPICNKHNVKAVIGYGDALLYYKQRYHWSYQRKRARMAASQDIPREFRELYEAACVYRLNPDLKSDFNVPRRLLQDIFLECERLRLHSPRLRWQRWHAAAVSEAFLRSVTSPRSWGRRLKRLSLHLIDPADRLALRLPKVAFLDPDDDDARERYLTLWGRVADPNFKRCLAAYDLKLSEEPAR